MTLRTPTSPDTELVQRVAGLLSPASPTRWTAARRGYTPAERWVLDLDDGSSVFVKAATDNATAEWLRAEHLIYSQVHRDFLPRMLGWENEGDRPVLVLEDLSDASWPPPWTTAHIQAVLNTLAEVRSTPPPDHVRPLDPRSLDGWTLVAEDPAPFLSLGMCSSSWLDAALPELLGAESDVPVAGDDFVHLDVRSDNLCIRNGRALLVDWNAACRANGLLDVAAWLPSLHAEGGPPPEEVSPDASKLAALISGYFAARAGQPVIERAPLVRRVQLQQLRSALPWAVRVLGLPPLQA